MRAALYLRVSTADQTTANQERELRAAAKRMGHVIVAVYSDNGISGSKGRNGRPEFDRLHRDAARRQFDIVMAWSVDRLGRSLQDLVGFLSELHALGIGLYLHQRGLDTTTPAGHAGHHALADDRAPKLSEDGEHLKYRATGDHSREGSPITKGAWACKASNRRRGHRSRRRGGARAALLSSLDAPRVHRHLGGGGARAQIIGDGLAHAREPRS